MEAMKKMRAWRVVRLTALAALVSSGFTAPTAWATSFFEAYDVYGAPVQALARYESGYIIQTCVQNSLGSIVLRRQIAGPDISAYGSGPFVETLYNPLDRSCSAYSECVLGNDYGFSPVKNGWGPNGKECYYLKFNAATGTPSGRPQYTEVFSGSALDSLGNRMVFDHILDESNAGAGPCPREVWIKGSRVTTIMGGTVPALDYVPPEGCTDYNDAVVDHSKIKAIYRAVLPGPDDDSDEIPNADDNCPAIANTLQEDNDQDGIGNVCDGTNDDDFDSDGVLDVADNCQRTPNADQSDLDSDGKGDACDTDKDGDGIGIAPTRPYTLLDNCPSVANPDQVDSNGDDIGDACDADEDGVRDDLDNCPLIPNPAQENTNGGPRGDACLGLPAGC